MSIKKGLKDAEHRVVRGHPGKKEGWRAESFISSVLPFL